MIDETKFDFDFFVEGRPAPGGSKSTFPFKRADGTLGVRVVDAGKGNKEWRKIVAWQAKAYLPSGWQPTARPMIVRFNFFLRRPAAHFGTGRNAAILKPGAPEHHVTKPDALKLARSTEDALTLVLWADDSQVISQVATKQYCGLGMREGCRVRVTLL